MSNLFAAAQALRNKAALPPIEYVAVNQQTSTTNVPYVYPSRNKTMSVLQAAIKAERHHQGLTQRQLASKAGMSQGTITRAEVHGWVSIWTMFRIIEALGQTIQVVKA